jgi:hypothetical protein
MRKGVRIGLALTATFSAGAVLGVVAGLQWARELQGRWARAERRVRPYALRLHDPAQWARDSARLAEWHARHLARPERAWPREVRRVQALHSCAVSFEVRDSAWGALPLFDARAWDFRAPGAVIAEGWTYREGGFRAGDTATVVLPNVYCADLVIAGFGASVVAPPRGPVRVQVR